MKFHHLHPQHVFIIEILIFNFFTGGSFGSECEPPEAPEDGRVIGNPSIRKADGKMAYTEGQMVNFKCNTGFGIAGPTEAVCLGDNFFSEDPPFCIAITCEQLHVRNGVVLANVVQSSSSVPSGRYLAGTTVRLRCERGHFLTPSNSSHSTCLENGRWSPMLGQCQKGDNQCEQPNEPTNARIIGRSQDVEEDGFYDNGATITYQCNDGFETQDSEQIVCGSDGEWSELPPVCLPIGGNQRNTCPPLGLNNGYVTPIKQRYLVGDTVGMICNDNFRMSPIESAYLMCIDGGDWYPSPGQCISTLPATTPSRAPPQRVTVAGPGGTTRASSCPSLSVANGEIWPNSNSYELGTMVTLYCRSGTRVEPSDGDWSMCQTNGQWYPPIGSCRTVTPGSAATNQCPEPDKPANSRVVVSRTLAAAANRVAGTLYSIGTRLVYMCDEGYYLVDREALPPSQAPLQVTIECMRDGAWSNAPPRCEMDQSMAGAIEEKTEIERYFKNSYWDYFNRVPSAKFRACGWGSVSDILPDPDNKFQALVICSSGSVVAVTSNCSGSIWRSVIGPPRGVMGWSQDPFFAAALNPESRVIYLTSTVKQLGILEANYDVVLSAVERSSTVQPAYLVTGRRDGPQYEGLAVDVNSGLIFSSDSSKGIISSWSMADGWIQHEITRDNVRNFKPRFIDLSKDRKLMAVSDYENSRISIFRFNADNISSSSFLGDVAAYAGSCTLGSVGKPGKAVFDMAGNIVVADGGCGRVQVCSYFFFLFFSILKIIFCFCFVKDFRS